MKALKVIIAVILTPLLLFMLVFGALYIPPIQNWAVHKACEIASEETGMDIHIDRVLLAFPLDLSLDGVKCIEYDSLTHRRDTVLYASRAVCDVRFSPLLDGEVKVKAIEMMGTTLNTTHFIPQVRVKGMVGRLAIDNSDGYTAGYDNLKEGDVAYINLNDSKILLSSVILDNAHLNVALADTVREDTTKSESLWNIHVRSLAVTNSDIALTMPDDTLRAGDLPHITEDHVHTPLAVRAKIPSLLVKEGHFDLGKEVYEVLSCNASSCEIYYDDKSKKYVPKGFDANHLAFSGVTLNIDSVKFQSAGTDLSMKIRQLALKEQSGWELTSTKADIALDSAKVKFDGTIKTPYSTLYSRIHLPFSAVNEPPHNFCNTLIDAQLGQQDLRRAMEMGGLSENMMKALPFTGATVKAALRANTSQVFIQNLDVNIPSVISLSGNGTAKNFMALADDFYSPDFSASIHCNAKATNLSFVKNFIDKDLARQIRIPALSALADIDIHGADYAVNAKITEGNATMKANARVNLSSNKYNADIKAHNLDVNHFYATGYNLGAVNLDAQVNNHKAIVELDTKGKNLDGKINLDALMDTEGFKGTLAADISTIDLHKLGFMKTPLKATICTHVDIDTDFKDYYKVNGMFSDIHIIDSLKTYSPDDIVLDILTRRDTTAAHIYCGDFEGIVNAKGGYRQLLKTSDNLTAAITKQIKERTIDQSILRHAFPTLTAKITCGTDNPFYRMLHYYDINFNDLSADISTSQENGINGMLNIRGLNTQGYKLDTIDIKLASDNDPQRIHYNGHIQNGPTNNYVFESFIDGELLEHGISLNARLYDEDSEMVLNMGVEATMEDEGIKFYFTPDTPVIGYETFALNRNNYIFLNNATNRITADVKLLAKDNTGIQIYSTDKDDNLYNENLLQDLTMSLNHLDIGKLTSSLPYVPKLEGMLYGDYHFVQNEDKSFSISTDMNVNNFIFEDCKIGNLGTELVYMPKDDGTHYIDGDITLNNKDIGTITGSYNFETSGIEAVLSLTSFPMDILNGFIPNQLIGFEGKADGDLRIQGTTTMPHVNGDVALNAAYLISKPYGIRLRIGEDKLSINNSKILFDNFKFYATNNSPLTLNGNIDFTNTEHSTASLRLRAENFLLIDAKETSTSEAYGKAFINLYSMVSGELSRLSIRGKLDLLPTTNLFYIMRDTPLSTDNRMRELVTFTDLSNLNDSTAQKVRHQDDGINADLALSINEGAHVKAWLSADHKNYLDFTGSGDLRMKYNQGEINIKGRYTIDEGEMKYSLPIIPLKTFTIANGSYLDFKGDMLNPTLSITATENVKTDVSINGTNQMVPFTTGVEISKTLQDMGLKFIIDSPENQSIADELKMMSESERSKTAVTMLTTGMYITSGNTSSFSMNSALNAFLQSEINNIAGSALRTLDVSFGMDRSTEEDGTIHTDYTFKFAKRFWNNRLNISVGGRISTGPEFTGQNKSFFDNVEMQYRLSDTSNQYMTLFYKHSVYDFLEGYVGQYGGGYMWKKKAQTLKEIFKSSSPATNVTPQTPTVNP